MTPQKNYSKWKQEQGLPVSGLDVTKGDTVQTLPTTPAEEAIKIALMLTHLFNHESNQ
jgi:hypothetical protein